MVSFVYPKLQSILVELYFLIISDDAESSIHPVYQKAKGASRLRLSPGKNSILEILMSNSVIGFIRIQSYEKR